VRRETASAYLKAAGVGVRPPGAWGRRAPAKPANEVTTGFGVESKAENPKRSVCEPFREAIELGLSRGRDATAIWQDLVRREFWSCHSTPQSLGSTGSLSSASTPNTHSCTRRSGSRSTNRCNASMPRANSRKANDRLVPRPLARRRSRCSGDAAGDRSIQSRPPRFLPVHDSLHRSKHHELSEWD
jgi:hypothetical protein